MNQILFIAKDAHQILHGFLQITMNCIRTLTLFAFEGNQGFARGVFDLAGINGCC